ncbi:hypothetical protein FISHEDRAFT_46701, partial [Fistulina hepatica ATCC 64428]
PSIPDNMTKPALPPRRPLKSSVLSVPRHEHLRLVSRPVPPPLARPASKTESGRPPPLPGNKPVAKRDVSPRPSSKATPEAYYPSPPLSVTTGFCLKCRNFEHVDAHATRFPRDTVTSLPALAAHLTKPFVSATDKARCIFTWLHHNVVYDVEGFFSGHTGPQSPDNVLRSGRAVCEGFAGLFGELAQLAGLHCRKVSGHGKGHGYAPLAPGAPLPELRASVNHAWNIIWLDDMPNTGGQWHLIDACWGAGALEGSHYNHRFDPTWFTSTGEEFGKRHFPIDGQTFCPAEDLQLVAAPRTWEQYMRADPGPTLFKDFHQLDLAESTVEPSTHDINVRHSKGGAWTTFRVRKLCEHMSTNERDNYVFVVAIGHERTPLELDEYGAWSAVVWVPIPSGGGEREVSLYSVTHIDGRDAFGTSLAAYKLADGRKSMKFGGLARWNVC